MARLIRHQAEIKKFGWRFLEANMRPFGGSARDVSVFGRLVEQGIAPDQIRRRLKRHRRGGIGAFLRMVTQARLQRPPSRASNSARPTVTMRPSGSGTAPPAASTAATSSRSAARYISI